MIDRDDHALLSCQSETWNILEFLTGPLLLAWVLKADDLFCDFEC